MKALRLFAAACLLIAASSLFFHLKAAQPVAASARPAVQWRMDLNAAREDSRKTGRPMLIVFEAEWCPFCRRMEQASFNDLALSRYINDTFIPVRLNIEQNQRTAEILEVESIPCTVALNSKADLLGRVTGYIERNQYQQALNRIQALHQKLESRTAATPKISPSLE